MKRARIFVAAGVCAALGVGLGGGGGEGPIGAKGKKPPVEQKELIKDPHAGHDHDDGAVKKDETKKVAEAKVSVEARAELDKLAAAYKELKALEVAGTLSQEVVTSEQTYKEQGSFV